MRGFVMTWWLAAVAVAGCLGGCAAIGEPAAPAAAAPPALAPIASLDVARYLGGWYEIARFPNWFQRHCARDTKAQYRALEDGRIEVDNRCVDESGRMQRAVGVARQIGAATSARLEVTFLPDWLSFVPFLSADYWVVDIDDRYSLAAVSEPHRDYLWILSRTPQVDAAPYDALLARLRDQGFDLTRLESTAQSKPGFGL